MNLTVNKIKQINTETADRDNITEHVAVLSNKELDAKATIVMPEPFKFKAGDSIELSLNESQKTLKETVKAKT